MGQTIIVKQINIYPVICDKCASNVWIWESLNSHCPIIDFKEAINVKLISLNVFGTSCLCAKSSHVESAIIIIGNGIFISS